MKTIYIIAATCVMLSLMSCSKRLPQDTSDDLPPIFPDYIGVTVPCNIAPMNFGVDSATHMQVVLRSGTDVCVEVSGDDYIDISQKDWQRLTAQAGDIEVTASVWSSAHPKGVTYKPFLIHVSADSIDPWIAYRLLPPGYEGWNRMGIYQRNLSSWEERTIIENSQANNGCVNCHAFANYSPRYFMMHIRGEGGGTLIKRNGKVEKVDIKSMDPYKHGSYNMWHPSGRYIAFTSNATHQSFYGQSRDKIEVYDHWSDLIIYDAEQHRVIYDDRFLGEQSQEIFPAFSPDGRWLYFSTAKPVNMPKEFKKMHYSIIRVPFDVRDASLGEVDTLYSAYERGGTALMPRISPDGRYMIYTVAECGAFNLYHNESDFQMMDLETRQLIDTRPLNSDQMESYHVWSSNGHWLLFASKRIDGRYTRLFMAHWDGARWSRPFMLPQRCPQQNTMLMMAYNIPEFIREPIDFPRDELARMFESEEAKK